MHHAHNIVHVLVAQGVACELAVNRKRQVLFDRLVGIEHDDVGTRNHHLPDSPIPEFESTEGDAFTGGGDRFPLAEQHAQLFFRMTDLLCSGRSAPDEAQDAFCTRIKHPDEGAEDSEERV